MTSEELREYQKRLYASFPLLGCWRRRHAAGELAAKIAKDDLDALRLLVDARKKHHDARVRQIAEDALGQLRHMTVVDAFCAHWSKTRHPELERILRQARYVAWNPPELRVLTALKTNQTQKIPQMPGEYIPLVIGCLIDPDSDVAAAARNVLARLDTVEARNVFCQHWARRAQPELEEILLQSGYVASAPPDLLALTALKNDRLEKIWESGKEGISALMHALFDSDEVIRQRARSVLEQLKDQDAIDTFCQHWAKSRNQELEAIMNQARYLASSPTRLFVLTRLKFGKTDDIQPLTERTIETLVQALDDPDQGIVAKAEKILRALSRPEEINYFCRRWEKDRQKKVLAIIRQAGYVADAPPQLRIQTASLTGKLDKVLAVSAPEREAIKQYFFSAGSAKKVVAEIERLRSEVVVPLIAVCADREKEVALAQRKALVQLPSQAAIDFFCFAWALTRDPVLESILTLARYDASAEIPRLRLLVALKCKKPELISEQGSEVVRPLIKTLGDADAQLASAAEALLRNLHHPEAVDAFCDILLVFRNPLLWRIAAESRYLPSDAEHRLLFHFITGQWDDFLREDPEPYRPRLRLAHSHAAFAVKKMLWGKAEENGKTEWLSDAFLDRDEKVRPGALVEQEWRNLSLILKQEKRWTELSRFLFLAPPRWSHAAVQALLHVPEAIKAVGPPLPTVLERMRQVTANGSEPPDIQPIVVPEGHKRDVDILAFSPRLPLLVTAGQLQDGVQLWEFPIIRLVRKIGQAGKHYLALAMSADGQLLAAGRDDGIITVCDFPASSQTSALLGHEKSITCLAFSPDGRLLASGSLDNTVRLWSLPDGSLRNVLRGHQDEIRCLAFHPRGGFLFSGSRDKTVAIWEIAHGNRLGVLTGHEGPVSALCLLPDGRTMASASFDKKIFLWNLTERKVRQVLSAHQKWVTAMALSSDGRLLASASLDGTCRLWSVPEGLLLRSWREDGSGITALALSPDRKWLACARHDKALLLWRQEWFKPLAYSSPADLEQASSRAETAREASEKAGWRFLATLLECKKDFPTISGQPLQLDQFTLLPR